ncbi:MAG: amidohydrolase family protein [Myxococcota bacterium]|nr:amidohydrolase family protein [Myxococcota bacterium]
MKASALLILLTLVACKSDSTSDTGTGNDTGSDSPSDTGDSVDPDSVTECGNDLGEIETGVCDVSAGSNGALLLRGTLLVPDDILQDGELLIDASGEILCASCDCSEEADYLAATVVTCPDGVVSPGLINPHDHIGYTEGAPIDHGATRYDHRHDWRGSLSTPQNSSSLGRELGELRMIIGGTTSMVGSGYADGMVRNLDESANEGLNIQKADNQTFPLGDSNEDYKSNCNWNYRDSELEIAQENAYIPHIAEGIDSYAQEEFRCSSTSFDGAQDYTEKNAAHVHSIGLSTEDYYRMAINGTQLVWSPRSNISLYGHTAQVTTFHRFGGILSLGTDWTYSGSIHTGRELACADQLNRDHYDNYFSDRELWEMATVNGAISTGTEERIGSLREGLLADIAVFDGSAHEPYRSIIDARADGVVLVLRAGEALYGESETLLGLGEDCESVDVCGASMAVCAQKEFGASYQTVIDQAAGDYAAFFCGETPDDEPTCVPSRPGEFTGISTADDTDGDGIANDLDNCPQVFNPIRPIDGGIQPDHDGDGEGDACDASPLLSDMDSDGVENEEDNCPFDANSSQMDDDEDAKGDECDACPEQANPESVCLLEADTTTIVDIQTGTVSTGDYVRITEVVVTAVTDSGFNVQDPSQLANPGYSGVYVYTSSNPNVTRGDVVEVEGEVGEYYDWTQLQAGSVTVLESANTGTCDEETGPRLVEPTPVTVSMAASEEYEGVLVTLTDAVVTTLNYDCSVDGSSCNDEGLWEVQGSGSSNATLLVYDDAYECSDWLDTIGELPVTGVMMYRWNRRRLMPSTTYDFN